GSTARSRPSHDSPSPTQAALADAFSAAVDPQVLHAVVPADRVAGAVGDVEDALGVDLDAVPHADQHAGGVEARDPDATVDAGHPPSVQPRARPPSFETRTEDALAL